MPVKAPGRDQNWRLPHTHISPMPPKTAPTLQVKSYIRQQSGFDMNVRVRDKVLPKAYQNGRWYVAALKDQDYQLVFTCPPSERYMVVCSVDGLNVVTGKSASARDTGYVIDHGSITIPGYWLGNGHYAKFHFGPSNNSYAAKMGTPDNTGVIAVKFFDEYKPPVPAGPVKDKPTLPVKPLNVKPHPFAPTGTQPDTLEQPRIRSAAPGASLAEPRQPAAGISSAATATRLHHDIGTEFGARVTVGQSETAPFVRGEGVSSLTIEYASPEQIARLRQTPLRTATPFPSDQSAGCKPPPGWHY
jgi:hypothetical protein